jgi:desampylase
MAAIHIESDLLARLQAEVRASPDLEICGLLFGEGDRVEAAQSTANVAANPATTFEIDPRALLAAHKAARLGGPKLVGCYHSHPSGSATPSVHDQAAAEPGSLWLIMTQINARFWRASSHAFEPLDLIVG